jgi:hypothetical protein
MKVNTDYGMKPNSFRPNRGTAFGFAGLISTGQRRWTTQWQAASPEREDQLASQEIVRAQDQRSSSIEV